MKKKTNLKTIKSMSMLVVLFFLFFGIQGTAFAKQLYYGYGNGDSIPVPWLVHKYTVTQSDYSHNLNSVWTAVDLYNRDGKRQLARDHIDFSEGLMSITLHRELTIDNVVKSSLLCPTINDNCFVFGPSLKNSDGSDLVETGDNGYLKRRISFAANKTMALSNANEGSLADKTCAIRIVNGPAVIQNMAINVNHSQTCNDGGEQCVVHGICIDAEEVVLHNVDVRGASGSAILLGQNVRKLTVTGGFDSTAFSNYGIMVLGKFDTQRKIDFSGIRFENIYPYMVKTDVRAFIDTDSNEFKVLETTIGSTRGWEIHGVVTGCDTSSYDNGGEVVPKDPTCSPEKAAQNPVNIAALHVYYVDEGGRAHKVDEIKIDRLGAFYNEGKFIINLNEDNLKRALAGKTKEQTDADDEEAAGEGKVADWKKVDIGAAPALFFMAETADGMGSSSNVRPLTYRPGTGGNGDGLIFEREGKKKFKFSTVSECRDTIMKYGTMIDFDFDVDTDDDMIPDQVEMRLTIDSAGNVYIKDGDCNPEGHVSYWNRTDSDGDGIPDGKELICANGQPISARDVTLNRSLCGTTAGADGLVGKVLLDTDGDGLLNVRDEDSDGDGLLDWKEDRAKLYQGTNRKAYFYEVGGSTNNMPFVMPASGLPVVCYDPSKDSEISANEQFIQPYEPTKGIGYGTYIVSEAATRPEPLTYAKATALDSAQTAYSIKSLACRSSALRAESNFNGIMDGSDCADVLLARKDDTQAEGVKVPGINECSKDCFRDEVLQRIDDVEEKYVTNGLHQALKDEDGNGIPNLFQEVIEGKLDDSELIQICGDYDDDGIPNCIEAAVANNSYNEIGNCVDDYRNVGDSGAEGDKFALNPYLADSDGDTFGDGYKSSNSDICPMVHSGATNTADVCGPEAVYADFPILAFYLDRDGDQLRDVDEFNGIDELEAVNGRFNEGKGQTNPIVADSDNDGINDYYERQSETNPNNPDSDSDGITDGDEIAAGNKYLYEPVPAGYDAPTSCMLHEANDVANRHDTNPKSADTDGDGLTDKYELFVLGTDPNDADTDNDSLCDGDVAVEGKCTGAELTIKRSGDVFELQWRESNPCSNNTDGDKWFDDEDNCPTIADDTNACTNVSEQSCGPDSDNDGLPDSVEDQVGTDANNPHSDADGLADGCISIGGKMEGELCNAQKDCYKSLGSHNVCSPPDYMNCDTNPLESDSDFDGLTDDKERKYSGANWGVTATPTNPTDEDTDGDCITDGPVQGRSLGEDKDADGIWDSDETSASAYNSDLGIDNAVDSDGDGLPDGRVRGLGEDMDCNGTNIDENGAVYETDPTTPDTDWDGTDDYTEMTRGGAFNVGNIGYATRGKVGGCSLAGDGSADFSLVMIFAGLVLVAGIVRYRMKRVKI